jgi:hypothetical protein
VYTVLCAGAVVAACTSYGGGETAVDGGSPDAATSDGGGDGPDPPPTPVPPPVSADGGGSDAGAAFLQTQIGGGSGTSITVKLEVTAHDTLVVDFFADNFANAVGVTDALGNMFVQVAGPASLSDIKGYLYVAYDVKPGTDTITAALDLSAGDVGIAVTEYAGILTNGLDIARVNNGSTTAKDSAKVDLTTTKPKTLVHGYGYATTPSADGTTIAGTGFTQRGAGRGQVVEDRILSPAGALSVTATMTTGTGWLMIGAAFEVR